MEKIIVRMKDDIAEFDGILIVDNTMSSKSLELQDEGGTRFFLVNFVTDSDGHWINNRMKGAIAELLQASDVQNVYSVLMQLGVKPDSIP